MCVCIYTDLCCGTHTVPCRFKVDVNSEHLTVVISPQICFSSTALVNLLTIRSHRELKLDGRYMFTALSLSWSMAVTDCFQNNQFGSFTPSRCGVCVCLVSLASGPCVSVMLPCCFVHGALQVFLRFQFLSCFESFVCLSVAHLQLRPFRYRALADCSHRYGAVK